MLPVAVPRTWIRFVPPYRIVTRARGTAPAGVRACRPPRPAGKSARLSRAPARLAWGPARPVGAITVRFLSQHPILTSFLRGDVQYFLPPGCDPFENARRTRER